MYNITDIIDKAILQGEKRQAVMKGLLEKCQQPRMRIMISILIKSIERDIEFHRELEAELKDKELEDIDIRIYDQIATLLNQFEKNLVRLECMHSTEEILVEYEEFSKSLMALFINIQGRLAENGAAAYPVAYEAMTRMISDKRKMIKDIERLVNQSNKSIS